MTLATMIEKGASAADIAAHLDALPAADRVAEVRQLGHREQEKLWELTKGKKAIDVAAFVAGTEQTNIYEGKNTLPAFSFFQKRFWRPKTGEIVGYNHNGGFVTAVTGPGYFLTVDSDNGEILFDYTREATIRPPEWPELKPNSGLLAGVVYGGMKDYCRYVAKGTVIGAAFKGGKSRNQYFMLTRSA